jgi:hypothetical protein
MRVFIFINEGNLLMFNYHCSRMEHIGNQTFKIYMSVNWVAAMTSIIT